MDECPVRGKFWICRCFKKKKNHLRKFTSNLIGQEMQRERKENYKKKFHMNDQ